jgi:hypothetical protein
MSLTCLLVTHHNFNYFNMSEHIHFPEKSPHQYEPFMSVASPIRDNDQIPPGYALFQRGVRLLNGKVEPAFYSTHEGQAPDPQAWERSGASLIEAFIWALTVPEFADHETEDDDRTQEIGNMMSYALSQGFTEDQVLECYKQAFTAAIK